jgi:hypothetical protein
MALSSVIKNFGEGVIVMEFRAPEARFDVMTVFSLEGVTRINFISPKRAKCQRMMIESNNMSP